MTDRLQVTVPVTLLLFRPSESPFAFLSLLFVLTPTFHRLAHLRPRLHRQFVMEQRLSDCGMEHVRRWSLCCARASAAARDEEPLVCVQWKANNSADVQGHK